MQNKYRVLIVEDKQSLRTVYAEYLRMEGFLVEEAKDGQEALDKAESGEFDIVLLDIMLPKIDGLEVLRTLKSSPKTKNIKVYLLTVLGRDAVIKEGFDSGADGLSYQGQNNPRNYKRRNNFRAKNPLTLPKERYCFSFLNYTHLYLTIFSNFGNVYM